MVFIIGNNIAATAAVSATAEPERLAIIIAARIATKPKPPRLCPTNFIGKSIIRLDKPPSFIISPAKMKNGIAINEKLSAPLTICCARIWASNKSKCTINATPQTNSENATGIPNKIEPSNTERKIITVI